jgi:ActR/RegA family two-component response regulator
LEEPVHVLWIDPDILSVAGYAVLLERRGWMVDRAESFKQALDLLGRTSYDIAIIELELPDTIASDAWAEIHQAHPLMQGIVTTRSPSLRANVDPLRPGVVAYLLKPLDMDSVTAIIDQALGRENTLPQPISRTGPPVEAETNIERRVSPRVPVRYPVIYSHLPPNPPPTRMIDLSEEGAAIEALDLPPVGAAISFMIIAGQDQVVDARATVVHVQPGPNFPYRIGVRFSGLSPSDRTILGLSIQGGTA